ncbi:MAG: enoyl-CoA hydratase/isomerase family protein [Geminicoccaceae bacterium]
MNQSAPFTTERRDDGVCTISLNRPDSHNAFDDRLISALSVELEQIGADDQLRAVVLTGKGRSFSAGADLNWMRRSAAFGEAENLADARALARLMATLNQLPKPTIARINGAALGGGVGLACCCDIAVAVEGARFGLTEVRLGLIPAVIGPYVIQAIGARQARRLMLTGERFDADEARRLGLIHQVTTVDGLDDAVEMVLGHLLASGPNAIQAAKTLIRDLVDRPITSEVIETTATRIAKLRITAEAGEGLAAFLEKRAPRWRGP